MAHSYSKIWTHIVFSTKNRSTFLKNQQLRFRLHKYIEAVCTEKKCIVASIGGVEDHIHLLVQLSRKIALSTLVEAIKTSSSKWVKSLPEHQHSLKIFYWQKGYAAFSVSQSNIAIVSRYIKNQVAHHKNQSFLDEFKILLMRHQISFEEKHLQDE